MANTAAALREAFGFFWVGFYPVSYTHLDVYKRQLYHDPAISGTVYQTEMGNKVLYGNPVSYTHLPLGQCPGIFDTHFQMSLQIIPETFKHPVLIKPQSAGRLFFRNIPEAYYQIAVEKGCNSNFLEDLKLAIEDFKAFQCEEPNLVKIPD